VRYGVGDRVTILSVGLGLDGRIKNLSVVRSSGLDFLDLEATQAFERAQPFPNPPVGLAKDGLIQFGFGFRISADASAPPQMFRFGR
jgi:TonB family protein